MRILADDLQQAIDTTHYLFALTIRDGVCTPALVDDTDWVEHSLATAIAARRRWENGGQADSPASDEDDDEIAENDEEEIEIHSDFEEAEEEEEEEEEDGSPMEDDDEGNDFPQSQRSSKPRPPWE